MRISGIVTLLIFLIGCRNGLDPDTALFTLLDQDHTQVDFSNTLIPEEDFNIIDYLYYYDGGGVAIGDINNDDLPDLYLTGNQVSDQLFLNQGNFKFQDITEKAGVTSDQNTWSTGVSMADVNGDGWLDIYVCNVNHLSKTGHNLLYINQHDGTFTEESQKFGLDFEGLSTHSAWLDFDLDGDLDLYLLNHAVHSRDSYVASWRRIIDAPKVGDKFYRQDNGVFKSITAESGIYSSALGYGLGLAVSDLNMDGWPDIYVGNDFHEDDYLYLNSGHGTFTESLWKTTGHTSRSTMGIDIADLNNDGYPDIVALDMLPPDLATQRTTGHASADALMRILQDFGYGSQVSRNTLQLHRGITPEGIPYFSEIGIFAGIEATDWSWSPLLGDFDGDGWKDLFVTNGILGRPNDLDYIEYVATPDIQTQLQTRSAAVAAEVARHMPSALVSNFMFQGDQTLRLSDVTSQWGLDAQVIGNGAAYGDLDLDGDLDLVINALNHQALVYRNESVSNFITVKLYGARNNTSAFGAKVHVWSSGIYQMQEQSPSRGFQSSVDHVLSFGIGSASMVDSVKVMWPSGIQSSVDSVVAGTRVILYEVEGQTLDQDPSEDSMSIMQPIDDHGISFRHRQDQALDFEIQPLLPYWRSTLGAALAVGDVNGDGLEDVFFGGARDQASELYLQTDDGRFRSTFFPDTHKAQEIVDAVFFDADGDEDLDLYVVSGGWTGSNDLHQDRIYLNSGSGSFNSASDRLPPLHSNGTSVAATDFDLDGDMDIFVGRDAPPEIYGQSGLSSLLENDGTGYFTDITNVVSPDLQRIGHVTGTDWADLIGDAMPDLALVGEWMPITIFENLGGKLINRTDSLGLSNSVGLWQSLKIDDLNLDGALDLVAGNLGLNTVFDIPIALFAHDLDQDGRIDPIIAQWHYDQWFVWTSRDALLQQLPSLSAQVPTYHSYRDQSVTDLFGDHLKPTHIVHTLYSSVFWNQSGTRFVSEELPDEVQWTPVMAINTLRSIDGSYGFIAGNISATSDAFGSANAGWGSVVHFDASGEMRLIPNTGFHAPGDTRQIRFIQGDPVWMLLARSDDRPVVLELFDFNSGSISR